MTKDGIANLLETIAVHFPAFEKRIYTESGNVKTTFIDEWYERIGYLDYEDAAKKFTEYLRSGEKYAPTVTYFLNEKPKSKAVELGIEHVFHVGQVGELLDEGECEYCDPENIETKYIYLGNKVIITNTGRIVQGMPTGQLKIKKCCGNCKRLTWSPLWKCSEDKEMHDHEDICSKWKVRGYAARYVRGENK